jgi:glucose-6-phosphate isomerase, archaeal
MQGGFTMKIYEPKLWHKISQGIMEGKDVKNHKKYLKDVKSLYKSENILSEYDPETIVYEVYSFGEGEEEKQGNLYWGMTVMHPLYIEGECNMTRGHFHQDRNCAEYYFGIEGEGLLLLMDDKGEMWAEKILPGTLHYIDGRYAHRMVNTGDTELKVGACWPTAAGHDYASIEAADFPYRIFKIDGRIEIVRR